MEYLRGGIDIHQENAFSVKLCYFHHLRYNLEIGFCIFLIEKENNILLHPDAKYRCEIY